MPCWPRGPMKARRAARRPDPERRHELLPSLHPAAHRHVAADGGAAGGRHAGLAAAAGGGAAAGRLSGHPGAGHAAGRQSRHGGADDHRAAGALPRPDLWPQADVLGQRRRCLGHHAAVCAGQRSGRGRAGRAVGAGQCREPAARWHAGPAALPQGQSGRHADPDAGGQLEDPAAAADPRPGGHPHGAEAGAGAGCGAGEPGRRSAPGHPRAGRFRRAEGRRAHAGRRAEGDCLGQRQSAQGQL